MQTFMPYPCFRRSVRALDNRRLGKQRVEAFQILRALRGLSKGWRSHPATLMWRGHEPALEQYLRECVLAWVERGFRNTMSIPAKRHDIPMPVWMGDERLHASHRANLLRKDAAYYARHGWSEDPSIPYHWPSV
jgi:hypothetical protein